MADLVNTGNRNTLLDNNLVVSSETTLAPKVLVVDSINNRVGINKPVPTVELDIVGSVATTSTFAVQTNKLIVDSLGNVGIGVTPSGTYRLEIVGNVVLTGTLQAFGPTTAVTATTFETQDPSLLLNRNGTDASSSGAGFTIQRTATNAVFNWNNTKLNFEAGLSGSPTSLIRAGGNSDGALISIGTNDNFGFNLRTSGTDRFQISNTGNTTIPGNLTVNGNITIDGQIIKNQGLPPGSVIPFMPGYFGNSSNGSFTPVLGTNTVASVNTWLTTNGYDQWRVCDGTNYGTNGSSPVTGVIFGGGTNRFVPQLTDDRFVAGANSTGSSGGTNSRDHTHNVPTALGALSLSHTHTLASATVPHSSVSFSIDAFSTVTTTGGASPLTSSTFSGTTTSFAHTHTAHSHTHPAGSYYARIYIATDASPSAVRISQTTSRTFPANTVTTPTSITPASIAQTKGAPAGGSTSGAMQTVPVTPAVPSGRVPAVTTSSLSTVPFTHNHGVTTHSHTYPHTHTATAAHSHGPGSHTHTLNSASIPTAQFSHTHPLGSATVTENRPLYLSCFYIMRVR